MESASGCVFHLIEDAERARPSRFMIFVTEAYFNHRAQAQHFGKFKQALAAKNYVCISTMLRVMKPWLNREREREDRFAVFSFSAFVGATGNRAHTWLAVVGPCKTSRRTYCKGVNLLLQVWDPLASCRRLPRNSITRKILTDLKIESASLGKGGQADAEMTCEAG